MKRTFFVILMIFWLAACAPTTLPTIVPFAEPTARVAVTATLTPIPLPTETLTPTSSPTPTAVPTLPVDAARARLLELLANNGGCRLPCLWGITPGTTSYNETRTILEPFMSISSMMSGFDLEGGSINPQYRENGLNLDTIIGIGTDEQIVNHIFFLAREFKTGEPGNATALSQIFDSKIFGERLHPYMLSQVFSVLGKPAAVIVSTDGGYARGSSIPGFYLVVFYPEQSLFGVYTTSRQLVDGKVRGCFSSAEVELHLYPPRNSDIFSELINQTNWKNLWPAPVDSPAWKSIEKATSMSLEQFYETFRNSTDQCIETPANLWPTPGPGGG